jgi:stage II sporulation protein D
MVITPYHSSCGGITSNAGMEWNRDLVYLVPVSDPFCDKSKNRNWNSKISQNEWNTYIAKTGYTGGTENLCTGEKSRRKYLDQDENRLTLTDIRRQFHLKSSWFNIEKKGNEIIFHGHGYGHGLGMCQEGAMEMARVGYTYVDILMFYFRGLELTK